MIVRCANCHTEFSLDDQQIGPEGATVRCSVCSYVFPVDPPPGAGDQPWQIRTVEDLLFTAPDLATLRAWIGEGRLHPDDQVSRTGRHWLRLGDMPEFSSEFSGFTDLPQVFEVEGDGDGVPSALDELGPPPSFGGTMPVVQGVDTGMLDLRADGNVSVGDDLPVMPGAPVVERDRSPSRPQPAASPVDPPGASPFPMAQVSVSEDPPFDDTHDESATRLRPRPHSPTRPVSAVPEVVDEQADAVAAVRRRPPNPTVRYGADMAAGLGLEGSSMLDAVTQHVEDDRVQPSSEGTEVRTTVAAVEATPPRTREPSGPRRAARDDDDRSWDDARAGRSRRRRDSSDEFEVSSRRRRRRHDSYDDIEVVRPRRAWPLVAGLGLLAGVAVVFGVPSIRAKVLSLAGVVAGEETEAFDPDALPEIVDARAAMDSLDLDALGKAEAALQGRLDGGKVPPAGVAAMKLMQVELLSTRALAKSIETAVAGEASAAGMDDVERAAQILGGVVGEDVIDRAHMRRARARLRLAQGRPAAEILPLLPEDGSGALRQLVDASPLWRDPKAPVPAGAVGGLQGLSPRSGLVELALGLAYLRAGDEAGARKVAEALLVRVPGQPTALALLKVAGGEAGAAGDTEGGDAAAGSDGAEAAGSGDGGAASGGEADDGAATPKPKGDKPAVRAESVDSLINRGCDMVESGNPSGGLEQLEKAQSRRPGDLDMLLCMGKAHAKQGRARDALSSYEQALRRSPSFAPALAEAARMADKLGQVDKAVGYYRKLLGARPGDPTALAYVEKHGQP